MTTQLLGIGIRVTKLEYGDYGTYETMGTMSEQEKQSESLLSHETKDSVNDGCDNLNSCSVTEQIVGSARNHEGDPWLGMEVLK